MQEITPNYSGDDIKSVTISTGHTSCTLDDRNTIHSNWNFPAGGDKISQQIKQLYIYLRLEQCKTTLNLPEASKLTSLGAASLDTVIQRGTTAKYVMSFEKSDGYGGSTQFFSPQGTCSF